jgi:putative flippase GtrA
MREVLSLVFRFKIKELLFLPTDNELLKFLRYAFVGGIAFVADYLFFAVSNVLLLKTNIGEIYRIDIATTIGFFVGIIVNFVLSKKLVFTQNAKVGNKSEFGIYAVIGLIGYFLNIALMSLFVLYINEYIAKIVVALIVLFYNYIARKKILYS